MRNTRNDKIYTPSKITHFILQKTIDSPGKIIDISCGNGNFLIDSIYYLHEKFNLDKKYIIENLIYGVDIDGDAVNEAILRIKDVEPSINTVNVYCCNSLIDSHFDILFKDTLFDYCIGNPPYIRIQHLEEYEKEILKNYNFCDGNFDLYLAFYEKGLSLLKESGKLCYISPTSFLRNKSCKNIQERLFQNRLISEIYDFQEVTPFEKVSAYVGIFLLDFSNKETYCLSYLENFNNLEFEKIIKSYKEESSNSFLFKEANTNIVHHNQMKDYIDVKVGLATLSDKTYFINCGSFSEEDGFIKSNKGLIEKSILKKCVKVGKLVKGGLEDNIGYIIFPYKKINDKYVPISEQELQSYPNAYSYLFKNKDNLLKRDSGKIEEESWFLYGRNQGLNNFGKKIFFPCIQREKIKLLRCVEEDVFYISGYSIYPKGNVDIEFIENILKSYEFYSYFTSRAKKLSGGFFQLTKSIILEYSW